MSNFIYHTPIHISVENIGSNKVMCEIGDIALMCPECFHMIKTNISSTKIINNINDPNNFNMENEYYGDCPNCKEAVRFEKIDINMADVINILNNKGYYTAFCCEGHIQPDNYDCTENFSDPYIYFYFWEDTTILDEYPLPGNWYIEHPNLEIFCIRGCKYSDYFETENEYIRYRNQLKNKWEERQEKMLKYIYDWAVSLPDKDEITKGKIRSIIDLYGYDIINKNAEKIIEASEEQ